MTTLSGNKDIIVSVVMPIYNEERYIHGCIESLLTQSYPKDKMEWIFVDGMSKDRTVEIVSGYKEKYPDLIKVLENEMRIAPSAMNIGISAARGQYIVRLDAHADYDKDYITKCVKYLDETDADNVGGIAETKSKGFIGNVIAKVLSTKFGVGNSKFRINGESGYVDTVPFGAFRREVFKRLGGYDERLVRNQDNEMNYRIRKNGGKIYLANDIRFSYYCRDTVSSFGKYALNNGKWNIITMHLCPGTMGARHFIPFLFVLSLLSLPIMSAYLRDDVSIVFALELLLYALLDAWYSFRSANSVKEFFLLCGLFPFFHISYGMGSLWGMVELLKGKYREEGYRPVKI